MGRSCSRRMCDCSEKSWAAIPRTPRSAILRHRFSSLCRGNSMTFSVDQYRLDGKVAVVTGAGGRGHSIGRAYALGLARAGASVVVADIKDEGAQGVCDE